MFGSGLRETAERTVSVPDASPDAFHIFLHFLYTGKLTGKILGSDFLSTDVETSHEADKAECSTSRGLSRQQSSTLSRQQSQDIDGNTLAEVFILAHRFDLTGQSVSSYTPHPVENYAVPSVDLLRLCEYRLQQCVNDDTAAVLLSLSDHYDASNLRFTALCHLSNSLTARETEDYQCLSLKLKTVVETRCLMYVVLATSLFLIMMSSLCFSMKDPDYRTHTQDIDVKVALYPLFHVFTSCLFQPYFTQLAKLQMAKASCRYDVMAELAGVPAVKKPSVKQSSATRQQARSEESMLGWIKKFK